MSQITQTWLDNTEHCANVASISPATATEAVEQTFTANITTSGAIASVAFNSGESGASNVAGTDAGSGSWTAAITYAAAGTYKMSIAVTLSTSEVITQEFIVTVNAA